MKPEPDEASGSEAGWRDPHPSAPLLCWRSLIADALAYIPAEERPASVWNANRALVITLFTSAGLRATLLYRLASAAYDHLLFPGKVLAAAFMWLLRHWYGCTISHRARIHGGLVLPHPHGLVIGPGVTVGPRAWIFHNVTLGGVPGRSGVPSVGSDARLFAGAVIVGPIRLGDNVFIAANTVVSTDVPGRTMVNSVQTKFSELTDRYLVDQD